MEKRKPKALLRKGEKGRKCSACTNRDRDISYKERLFEDQTLGYGNTFNYTFSEIESYDFNVSGYQKMQMTITVK